MIIIGNDNKYGNNKVQVQSAVMMICIAHNFSTTGLEHPFPAADAMHPCSHHRRHGQRPPQPTLPTQPPCPMPAAPCRTPPPSAQPPTLSTTDSSGFLTHTSAPSWPVTRSPGGGRAPSRCSCPRSRSSSTLRSSSLSPVPTLQGDSRQVVAHRGGELVGRLVGRLLTFGMVERGNGRHGGGGRPRILRSYYPGTSVGM